MYNLNQTAVSVKTMTFNSSKIDVTNLMDPKPSSINVPVNHMKMLAPYNKYINEVELIVYISY